MLQGEVLFVLGVEGLVVRNSSVLMTGLIMRSLNGVMADSQTTFDLAVFVPQPFYSSDNDNKFGYIAAKTAPG